MSYNLIRRVFGKKIQPDLSWVQEFDMYESDVEQIDLHNVPSNIKYILHKPTHTILEFTFVHYGGPIAEYKYSKYTVVKETIWRNVTFCFDWKIATDTNRLPREFTFWQKIWIFLFLLTGQGTLLKTFWYKH